MLIAFYDILVELEIINQKGLAVRRPFQLLFINYANNPTEAVNAIVLTDADRLILLIMRDQAVIAEFLDVNVTVDNEDANLADINGITLFNEYLITVVIGRLHTITAN